MAVTHIMADIYKFITQFPSDLQDLRAFLLYFLEDQPF